MFVTSCDEIGRILGHLPTQQKTAVDENEFSVLMMYLLSVRAKYHYFSPLIKNSKYEVRYIICKIILENLIPVIEFCST